MKSKKKSWRLTSSNTQNIQNFDKKLKSWFFYSNVSIWKYYNKTTHDFRFSFFWDFQYFEFVNLSNVNLFLWFHLFVLWHFPIFCVFEVVKRELIFVISFVFLWDFQYVAFLNLSNVNLFVWFHLFSFVNSCLLQWCVSIPGKKAKTHKEKEMKAQQ